MMYKNMYVHIQFRSSSKRKYIYLTLYSTFNEEILQHYEHIQCNFGCFYSLRLDSHWTIDSEGGLTCLHVIDGKPTFLFWDPCEVYCMLTLRTSKHKLAFGQMTWIDLKIGLIKPYANELVNESFLYLSASILGSCDQMLGQRSFKFMPN